MPTVGYDPRRRPPPENEALVHPEDHPIPSIDLRGGGTIPQIGLGTLSIQADTTSSDANAETTAEIVGRALSVGYRHIDTAQSYGTERGVGMAIAASGIPREDLFITSKLGNGNHEPENVRRSFDKSLENLGLDRLDLFLIHWPLPTLYDGDYVSTWKAVAALTDDGRLRHAGVSNFQPEHLERIVAETGIVPAVDQFEQHPYFPNTELRATCAHHGIAAEAYSPLGHGGDLLSDPTITAIAEAHGCSAAQIVLRWHIQRRTIVIPKSVRTERMASNLDVLGFELTEEEMARLDGLDRGPSARTSPDPYTYAGRPHEFTDPPR